MKHFLLILMLVMGQSVLAADKKSLTKEESAKVIEAEIRRQLKKPKGELTKADLEKVKRLNLQGNKLTDVKGLENLTQLKELVLSKNQLTEIPKGLEKLTQFKDLALVFNHDLTKAGIDQLQKELPNCKIFSNAKK
jgi:Leucine-rich repeat (LRR) protein